MNRLHRAAARLCEFLVSWGIDSDYLFAMGGVVVLSLWTWGWKVLTS